MFVKDVEKMIVGSVKEVIKDRNLFHNSTVGPEYCHLTEEGREAIVHVVEEMFRGLQTIHKQEVKEEAKRQTLEALK